MTAAFLNHKTLYLNLPQSWKRMYIKYCNFKLGSGKTPSGGSAVYLDAGIALIRSLNVYDDGLRAEGLVYIDENTNYEMANTRLKEKDVLLNITGASIGRSCIVPRWVLPANVNQHVCIIRPTKDVLSQYLAYVFKSAPIKDQINAYQQGSSREGLNFAQVGDLAFLLPPIPIQHQIASFLDRKTAAIDTLITKKQRLIQLFKEKRTALINQAVTKGLNPNVPMKYSGIPWIGKIPEHWNVFRLRHLISEKVAGPYGSSLTKSMYTSSGYRVYGQQQVIPNDFTLGDYYISSEKFAEMRRYEVNTGDVLVTVMGTIGRVAVVPEGIEPGIINPRLVRYIVRRTHISSEFFAWIFRSQVGEVQLTEMAQGVTMDGLNLTVLSDLWMPVPSLTEQNHIVLYIQKIIDKYNKLQKKVNQQIDLLFEYRQSLITAAVTGKIDIREEVAA